MKIISPSIRYIFIRYVIAASFVLIIGSILIKNYMSPIDQQFFNMMLYFAVVFSGCGLIVKYFLVQIYLTDDAIYQKRDNLPLGINKISLDKLAIAKETYRRIYLKSIDDEDEKNFIIVPKLALSHDSLNEVMSNVVT